MKRYNALVSKSAAEARASYRELGLCYVCGTDEKSCLHVDVKNRMGEPAYSEWIASFNGIGPGYDNLIIQRRIFAEKQAERDTRKGEPMHVHTGLLDRTPTAAQLRAERQARAGGEKAQDAENQAILDWLEGWNKLNPGPLGESPTETRSTLFGF
jgi:hypothetical protein